MKKLSNTEAELKKNVAYKKSVYFTEAYLFNKFMQLFSPGQHTTKMILLLEIKE